jgi:hypothetical protein
MADLDKIMTALRNAHAAGDAAAAKRLAAMAKAAQSQPSQSQAMTDGMSKLSDMTRNPTASLDAEQDRRASERTVGQALYDNLIGDPNDGVDSAGERLGRGLNDAGKGRRRWPRARCRWPCHPPRRRGEYVQCGDDLRRESGRGHPRELARPDQPDQLRERAGCNG